MCYLSNSKSGFKIKIVESLIFINMTNRVPITRIGKFFGADDYNLDLSIGEEYLYGDLNFTLVLYRIDKLKTKTDDVYGEALKDGIKFLAPIEFKGLVQISEPENKNYGNSRITQTEPGNLKVSVYQKQLDELDIDISFGDYIGYYETEDRIRYYTVTDDGRIISDNKHTYAGYKPFYRTIIASAGVDDEFRGL
jgi:hypothetical protein